MEGLWRGVEGLWRCVWEWGGLWKGCGGAVEVCVGVWGGLWRCVWECGGGCGGAVEVCVGV